MRRQWNAHLTDSEEGRERRFVRRTGGRMKRLRKERSRDAVKYKQYTSEGRGSCFPLRCLCCLLWGGNNTGQGRAGSRKEHTYCSYLDSFALTKAAQWSLLSGRNPLSDPRSHDHTPIMQRCTVVFVCFLVLWPYSAVYKRLHGLSGIKPGWLHARLSALYYLSIASITGLCPNLKN